MVQNWRIDTDAAEYFNQLSKRLQLLERRPVIRRASDLVGPGIDATAVRVSDWNDQLAQFNGFFSSDAGAANAPNTTSDFLGFVSSDSDLGGVQTVYPLDQNGVFFRRVFVRSPADSSTIFWNDWIEGNSDTGLFLPLSMFLNPGDLIVGGGASAPGTMPVGTDGQIIVADSAQPLGMRWGNAPSTGARQTSPTVTATVAAAGQNSTTIALDTAFTLLSMTLNHAARIRLYARAADLTSDASRPVGTDPADGVGVILDYNATSAGTFVLSPMVIGASMEGTPTSSISMLIDNLGGSSATISVSFVYQPTE